jgi:hypothetical protein
VRVPQSVEGDVGQLGGGDFPAKCFAKMRWVTDCAIRPMWEQEIDFAKPKSKANLRVFFTIRFQLINEPSEQG